MDLLLELLLVLLLRLLVYVRVRGWWTERLISSLCALGWALAKFAGFCRRHRRLPGGLGSFQQKNIVTRSFRGGPGGNTRLGLAWLGLAWLGLAWLGLAWLGLASLRLTWLGLAWLGLAWPDSA